MFDNAPLDVVPVRDLVTSRYSDLWKHSVIGCWRGSIVNGMYSPDSIDDVDAFLVVIPDEEYYFGLKEFGSRGTVEIKEGKYDIVVYEMRKFIRMLEQGNPNVLSTLWTRSEYHFLQTTALETLAENRGLFVGKHVYRSFCGYAYSQLKRLKTGAYTDKSYQCTKRREMFQHLGFDAKAGAHLVRLLRLGVEFLQTGSMSVYRPDAAELLQIKCGEWSLTRIESEANRLFARAKEAYEKSPLSENVDSDKISQLCAMIIRNELNSR